VVILDKIEIDASLNEIALIISLREKSARIAVLFGKNDFYVRDTE